MLHRTGPVKAHVGAVRLDTLWLRAEARLLMERDRSKDFSRHTRWEDGLYFRSLLAYIFDDSGLLEVTRVSR